VLELLDGLLGVLLFCFGFVLGLFVSSMLEVRLNDLKEMIADINRAVADDTFSLNEWETEFLESISNRVKDGFPLSDRQEQKLLEIWQRAK
jgi:hypothetical protein